MQLSSACTLRVQLTLWSKPRRKLRKFTSFEMANFDIVSSLLDYGLLHVIDSVIDDLDVKSICNFEAVSTLWRSLVVDDRHWRTKFKNASGHKQCGGEL